MTAHQLARKLLDGPDLPVTIPVGVHSSWEDYEEVEDAYAAEGKARKSTYNDPTWPVDHIILTYKA